MGYFYQITNSCISCGSCIYYCPDNAIMLNNKTYKIDKYMCSDCGFCADLNENVCPEAAFIRIFENF